MPCHGHDTLHIYALFSLSLSLLLSLSSLSLSLSLSVSPLSRSLSHSLTLSSHSYSFTLFDVWTGFWEHLHVVIDLLYSTITHRKAAHCCFVYMSNKDSLLCCRKQATVCYNNDVGNTWGSYTAVAEFRFLRISLLKKFLISCPSRLEHIDVSCLRNGPFVFGAVAHACMQHGHQLPSACQNGFLSFLHNLQKARSRRFYKCSNTALWQRLEGKEKMRPGLARERSGASPRTVIKRVSYTHRHTHVYVYAILYTLSMEGTVARGGN